MSRRDASFTQADVARAIRAAKQEGAGRIEIVTAGGTTIRVTVAPDSGAPPVEPSRPIVL
jgi:hypothetical protein